MAGFWDSLDDVWMIVYVCVNELSVYFPDLFNKAAYTCLNIHCDIHVFCALRLNVIVILIPSDLLLKQMYATTFSEVVRLPS